MPLSPETEALIHAAEAALLSARVELGNFTAATQKKAQRISHDDYVSLLARSQAQPWTITEQEQAQLNAQGPVNGVAHNQFFAASAPGSPWNPTPQARQKAQQFAAIDSQRRVATHYAEHKPPVKDRAYYRRRWGSSCEGRQECSQHAASMSMTMDAYRRWLWSDSPATPTPGAHSSHVTWAKRVLGGAA